MKSFNRERFDATCAALGIRPRPAVFEQLERAYGAADRHYHDAAHVDACLTQFRTIRDDACRPAEVEIALWFHDAIYDTHRNDNEARSADWAADFLHESGAADDVCARVREAILATRHDVEVPDDDRRWVVDVDLGILGQSPDAFARYDAAIRREYAWVPWPQYVDARIAVLRGFLARAHIYRTPRFRERYEAQARRNMAAAIEDLTRRRTDETARIGDV